jgi:photosystem II stability/assembly factor-like uncharacterized protein
MKKYLGLAVFSFLFSFNLLLTAQNYAWKKLDTEPYKGKQDDIYFVDENTGWYVNGYGKIFHTSNGGATWTMQLEKKGTFFRCIAFIDSLTGFAGTVGTDYFPNVTDSIPLYKTTDGGKNWSPTNYSGKYVKGLCAIDIVKEVVNNHGEIGYKYHVYAVGRVGSPANFMVSHDGGATFTSMDMMKYCAALYDIKMQNKNEGYACASTNEDMEKGNASIIYTKDGGATWKTVYQSKRSYETAWKIFFPSKKIAYASIQSYNPDSTVSVQHFVKTTNGGKSWKEGELCNDFKARSFGVGFIDDLHGFIGTVNSGYETKDGGKTWIKTDMGRACNKIRIVRKPNGSVYGYGIGVSVLKLMM